MAGGMVYLVGAGPGAPDLITVRGLRCLREADVVVYDRLVSSELLQECRPSARRVYVGKASGSHALPQERINRLLIKLAREGHVVCRLKGGDPFVFGRGGEEALALAEARVPFEVVPGVTSAVAVPGAAGIPVTHRGVARSFTVLSGHGQGGVEPDIDWEAAARLGGTLLFLMGVSKLADIAARLMAGGLHPSTPAAVVEKGTMPDQRTVVGTLECIAGLAKAAGVGSPAILVVGEVVGLQAHLSLQGNVPALSAALV